MAKTIIDLDSVGLVLSGGGVRGLAHIGVIKAMKENNINATTISGSSAGALVGALYANGNSIEEMLDFFKETPIFKYNFLTMAKAGFIDTDKYITLFKNYFPEDSFEALGKKLFLVATNLQKGEETYFSSGELIRPLLASAALPPVFSPVEMNGTLYADGGIMNNFPIEPVQKAANFIIGSNVSVISSLEKKELKNAVKLAARVTNLMIYASSKQKLKSCNIVIEPIALEKIGVLDKRGMQKAFEIGYEHASKKIETYLESRHHQNLPLK
ncbi:NTE family protein [Maribacter vaceletii]|uniref:NTE family protein n=1 Tax=Maribacter vaceletii TaxID=1206816 RepID=A0A495ECZ7_9FLAO|nr:patatin-like phospholipase family protein [Maribacter vaceletii]RKR14752.1 NTE family protein [Maribacter vaceletii]